MTNFVACLKITFIGIYIFYLTNGLSNASEWAIKVKDLSEADAISRDTGLVNKGKIAPFDDIFLFIDLKQTSNHSKRSIHHKKRIERHKNVLWVEKQVPRIRVKRDGVHRLHLTVDKRSEIMAYRSASYDDTKWQSQWYLKDQKFKQNSFKLDLHVIPAWSMGFTGKGVVVTVLDDGLEWNNTDLFANYDPKASFDLNDNDTDPLPRYDPTNENKHGTRCAGEIAMVANNGFCGVGIAFNAKIGGVRLLDGSITDRTEAQAIAFNHKYIDIYSSSWGPNDDGRTLEGPGTLANEAFVKGITEGRGGKGVIYVWASGNGGRQGDNCDCDGYTGSIYTISISSASQQQLSPWYAEKCASTMAATYSSGTFGEEKIVTVDLHNTCTENHSGTSASAPLAAGVFALVLEANPDLTWRDMQHLIAWTSQYAPLADVNSGWKTNGAGFKVNSRFGFGLLDAHGLTRAAIKWKRVPEKRVCELIPIDFQPIELMTGSHVEVSLESTGCVGNNSEITFLEHVQLYASIEYSRRGDLRLNLTSPNGTQTMILSERAVDFSSEGFVNWPFMSVHTWGEDPKGTWRLRIIDNSNNGNKGRLTGFKIVLHGTYETPDYYKNGPRDYEIMPTQSSYMVSENMSLSSQQH